jgi:hypothetical protein
MIYKNANPYRCHFNISLIYRSYMLRKLGHGLALERKHIPGVFEREFTVIYNSNFKIKKLSLSLNLNLKTQTELFGENNFFYHPYKNFYNSKNSQDGK